MAALGQRSMELGLKVGLWQTLADRIDPHSFETWYRPNLYVSGLRQAHTAPLFLPKPAKAAYEPFITMLRANMRYAGALAIPLSLIDEQQYSSFQEASETTVYLQQPVAELLGIIALESLRNRCQVICLHERKLADDFRTTLGAFSILTYRPGHFETEADGDWLQADQYPPQSVVAASDDQLISLNGVWLCRDIDRQERVSPPASLSSREEQIITRAAERAKLLVALQRQELLPEEYDVDPSTVPWLSPDLIRAIHLFLAQTTSKVFLLPMQDLPWLQEQDMTDEESLALPGWQRKLGLDLESLAEDEQLQTLFHSFCLERGLGVVRPSALLTDRRTSRVATIPRAFYRLQMNHNFTFRQAAEVVPYLHELGISHCYTSPCLKARASSPHGYDIIDHAALNPELGSREEFEGLVAALDQHQMAQIIDVVPNHMGVGSDNRWWMDVLENGQASLYADFFDINWQPQEQELQNRVLLHSHGSIRGRRACDQQRPELRIRPGDIQT